MRAEAHIPQADEALRALFARFKDDPGSSAFEELADALLARGHASEAQIVAEHGLQLDPLNANGHVHRAAAMLALGRARVAYVELVRALAIQPHHPRGMRLLGQVFKDAGLPERAAALLAQRHLGAPTRAPSTIDARHLYEPLPQPKSLPAATEPATGSAVLKASVPAAPRGLPPISAAKPAGPAKGLMSVESSTEIQDLFASLTKDLGLGGTEQLASRVEVTQVMRLRRLQQEEPREAELSSIEGPIVEATQPGQLQYDESAPPPPADFLFDVVTTPQLAGLGPDEPLFNDVQPLTKPATGTEDADTVNEDAPPMLDMGTLQAAMQTERTRDSKESERTDEDLFAVMDKGVFSGGADPPTREIPYLKRFGRAAREDRTTLPPPSPAASTAPRLTVVQRTVGPRPLILAGVGALILAGWLAGVAWVARDSLAVWMGAPSKPVVPDARPDPAARNEP